MTVADVFARTRRDAPLKEAVVCGNLRLTYAQLGGRVDRLAASLHELGLRQGAPVAVLEKNCHRYIETYLAAAQLGIVLVPLNYRLAPRELAEILIDSEAQGLMVGQGFLPVLDSIRLAAPQCQHVVVLAEDAPAGMIAYEALLRQEHASVPLPERKADDLLYLYYTSGTTGRPKGAMLTEGNVAFNAEVCHSVIGYRSEDRYLHAAPMFHLADAASLWALTRSGACHVCLSDFEPVRCLQMLQDERISVSVLVPTMINFLLNAPNATGYNLDAWRLLVYGASPMPEALIRRVINEFDVKLEQAYGMTELSPIATILFPEEHVLEGPERFVRRLRSAGRAVPGVEVRVVDDHDVDVPSGEVGEVIVRGPNVMRGYWKQPEATAEALRGGWMHTGDMATLDEDAFVYIVDRKKDMIISGGENVYSTEVEAVLYQHPAVLEAAVVGVPDPRWGEAVLAIIAAKPGQQVTADELRAYCRERIAGYKIPRSVNFLESLPKTATGKISKKDLRAPYWAAQSDHGALTDALLESSAHAI
jgi:acyl-CoA synthetase (AMP-forming)/AMP-acid ligase II